MKTNLDQYFKTNPDYEKDGILVEIDGKTSFKIRRFSSSNPRTKAAMATYYKPYARQIEMGTIALEKADEITMKLFIEVCLVSWEGVTDDKGQPIECNKENAMKLFKGLPDLFDALWKTANSFESFKDIAGNS